jgi:HIP---CoA ligase
VTPDALTTIPSVVRRAAAAFGDEEAVVDGGERVTFGELAGRVDDAAAALVATGIEPGDRVALWAPNSLRWIVASFAVYAAGAVLVPVNTRFKGEEAGHVLRRSGARLLFGSTDAAGTDLLAGLHPVSGLDALTTTVVLDGERRNGAAAGPVGTVTWDSFVAGGGGVDRAHLAARSAALGGDDLSDLVFTSGTTGAPKGAMLTHGASIRTYESWAAAVGLRRGDRYLVVYPFFHTAGLKSAVLACVMLGATIVPHAVFDAPSVAAVTAAERISVLPGPPTVFQSILDHPDAASFDLSTVRLSVTGAAVVPVEVVRRMREDLHIATVVTGYGLTETTGTVSMCSHDDPPEVVATTVGRPLPGVDVRIAGDDGASLPPGEAGEILVRGFNVMRGYFDDPLATAEAVDADGWLRTGDIGYVDEAGNLHITDRKKDMFIVGGFNAYPAEIEGVMVSHPAVSQVAVVGAHDDRLGEVGVAFVVATPGQVPDEDELIAWCRERMANYKVPRAVRTVDALPLNPSGKVMKYRLREQLA